MSGFGADSFGLCGTGIFANDVLCEVIHQLEGASAIADDYSSTATVALRNLAQNSSVITSDLANIQYGVNLQNIGLTARGVSALVEPEHNVSTVGIDTDFDPPTDVDEPLLRTSTSNVNLVAHPTGVVTEPAYSTDTSGISFTHQAAEPASEPPYTANIRDLAFTHHGPGIATEPSYSGLSPTSPTLPAEGSALISDAALDAVFTKALDRASAAQQGQERDAVYLASSMGIGLPSASVQAALRRARQDGAEKTQTIILEQAVQTGIWKREDTKTVADLHLQRFNGLWNGVQIYLSQESARLQARIGQINANIAAEAERRGWTDLHLKAVLESAAKDTERFQARISAAQMEIADETARRGWTELQVKTILDAVDKSTSRYQARIADRQTNIADEASRRSWSETQLSAIFGEADRDTARYQARISNANQQVAAEAERRNWSELSLRMIIEVAKENTARMQARIENIKANIAIEADRRGWSELQLRAVLEQADKETLYAVKLAETIAMLQMNITTKYTELAIGAMQAAFSAQHYNLTGSASQDVQASVSA